jgi:hypothetical protein
LIQIKLKINLVFYIDGGIHANEMQGVEVATYGMVFSREFSNY